jgi:hypothetical protein
MCLNSEPSAPDMSHSREQIVENGNFKGDKCTVLLKIFYTLHFTVTSVIGYKYVGHQLVSFRLYMYFDYQRCHHVFMTVSVLQYCDMHACLRPLRSNGPRSAINSGNACC